ncbi:RNA-directed DNA polymerase, eukaryota, reverse transcriptase zinc-binding domain protein [Tanacetum coccineum]
MESSHIPSGCNSSFITLIPKQTAFIKGRQILDDPLLVNELVDWYKKKKKKMMILKIDFEKAFDSISWDYLDNMLEFMNFPTRWRRWIFACLYSARSVLINGSPTQEFMLHQGLRQGDHLSPFLFIINMEGLHVAMEDAKASNLYCGILLGMDNLRLSHLFYADDVLFIGDWSQRNVENLVILLHFFFMASGLKINFSKSNLYGINHEVNGMSQLIGCQPGKIPFIYLGLPVGDSMSKIKAWDTLINRFQSKLSRWKVTVTPPKSDCSGTMVVMLRDDDDDGGGVAVDGGGAAWQWWRRVGR